MTITVVPSDKDVPLIQDIEGTPADIAARVEAFFNTAQVIKEAGGNVEVDEKARDESRAIFNGADNAPAVPSSSAVAMHLKALVNEYDHQVLESNIQARQYIVNRLLSLSDPNPTRDIDGREVPAPKPMEQLKALEMLGKVSEIGLFTERVEISINTKTTEELEADLVKTLSRYMNGAKVIDEEIDPILGVDLDVELGRVKKAEIDIDNE